MGLSYQQSYVHSCLIGILKPLAIQFTLFSRLSLDIQGEEYIPNLSLYPKRTVNFGLEDIPRMTEMPLSAIEILSSRQTIHETLTRIEIYLRAGVKSCWLVIPATQTVTVYTAPNQGKIFKTGEIHDPVLDIRVPLESLFA